MMIRRSTACRCVRISSSVLKMEPDLLHRVITGDETWILEYNPETKCQSTQWKSLMSSRPKKAKHSKSKVVLIMFFDVRFIVHSEFLSQGWTVNQQVYKIMWYMLYSVCKTKVVARQIVTTSP